MQDACATRHADTGMHSPKMNLQSNRAEAKGTNGPILGEATSRASVGEFLQDESLPIHRTAAELAHPLASKLTSLTKLSAEELDTLEDADLLRYLKQVAARMEAANALWERDGCFAAKGNRDSLWVAEQAALREHWKRPHLVAARYAEIESRMALEPGAERA